LYSLSQKIIDMKITNHLLEGSTVKKLSCPKNNRKFGAGYPDSVIIHYTAGSNAENSANYLCKDSVKASAHLVIGRDARIFQLVPFDTIAWHAGESAYNGRSGYNNFSIGIELDNAGLLTKTKEGYQTWFGNEISANEVIKARHRNEATERNWQTYTQVQLQACREVCILLIEKYAIKEMLGHEEIAPLRKQDPGPAFPLDKMRNLLLYGDRQEENPAFQSFDVKVLPDKLNIRTGPGTGYEASVQPLLKDTRLKVLEEKNGWYRVETTIRGWVSKDFVEKES